MECLSCSSSTDQEHIFFSPFLLASPSPFLLFPVWRWIWSHFLWRIPISAQVITAETEQSVLEHIERKFQVAVARGTHNNGVCRGSGSSKQFWSMMLPIESAAERIQIALLLKIFILRWGLWEFPKPLLATTCHENLLYWALKVLITKNTASSKKSESLK